MKFRKALAFFLIKILLILVINNALFRHTHYLPDGSGIEHAHPFFPFSEQEKDQQHKHSSAELMILDSIFHLERILIIALIVLVFVRVYFRILHSNNRQKFFPFHTYTAKQLRAPPL